MSIPEIVSIEEFIEWMIAEPQTIVWLPTLHRLAVSETGSHFLFVCNTFYPLTSINIALCHADKLKFAKPYKL